MLVVIDGVFNKCRFINMCDGRFLVFGEFLMVVLFYGWENGGFGGVV